LFIARWADAARPSIGDVRDLMFALQALKPGDVVVGAVRRGEKRLELKATLESRAPR
jgi:S1-C subfamily serine protease